MEYNIPIQSGDTEQGGGLQSASQAKA